MRQIHLRHRAEQQRRHEDQEGEIGQRAQADGAAGQPGAGRAEADAADDEQRQQPQEEIERHAPSLGRGGPGAATWNPRRRDQAGVFFAATLPAAFFAGNLAARGSNSNTTLPSLRS